ncbi:MAG TPA: ribosome biogenesis GTPase Der [Gammaproteobacteria bacterium]|jgi:GTP-binding protein|nr:ribosome biogenesis GTPase Der [Gammaproteobacteria bacterium]
MLPVIALIGRPNVGKSTLFNFLTRTRDALVADVPGLTRDRKYGFGKVGPRPYVVVDTGGLDGDEEGIKGPMAKQSLKAVSESDAAVFLVDGRAGLTDADKAVAMQLRRMGKTIYVAVNKTEGMRAELVTAEFHALGLGEPHAIASAHGDGVAAFIEAVLEPMPPDTDMPADDGSRIHVAVIGRPNVGKSTLINRLLGEERMVTYDKPGTTRDSVFVPFERDGRDYTLIDTAGVRRKSRVDNMIEKFSIVKTLQAIDKAEVVIAVLDASEGITEQDASLLGLAVERGRALVLAVNKWDGLDGDQRAHVRRTLDLKLPFLDFARLHFISALHGTGVGDVMVSVNKAYRAAMREMGTSELTRVMEAAIVQHQPPMVAGRRIRLRYAHQGGSNPPVIVIHGNQTDRVPDAYKRYLMGVFREAFELQGTPVRIELRTSDNPYDKDRKKTTTPKQAMVQKRERRLGKDRKKRAERAGGKAPRKGASGGGKRPPKKGGAGNRKKKKH